MHDMHLSHHTPHAAAYNGAQHALVMFGHTPALHIAKPFMAAFGRVCLVTLCDSSGMRPLS